MKLFYFLFLLTATFAAPDFCVAQQEKPDPTELINKEAIQDLKGLHAAAVKYIKDKGSWPQFPKGIKDLSEDKFYGFFKGALKPYGATPEMWKHSADKSTAEASYVPSMFDDKPNTPYRWNQPWFISRGTFPGNFLIQPDGSVSNLENLTGKMTKENP